MVGELPLQGIKVLEFAGLAPGPFAGMMLADAGASVMRVDRAQAAQGQPTQDILARHKSSIAVNLKSPQGIALLKKLSREVDVIIDPYRPGVMEKLGLGPDDLMRLNPRLIYGRMTGFRRDGKYAAMAGHDINYLAVSGTLGLLGREGQRPHAPWNILADFAGGGAKLFQGILLAVVARQKSGKGQIVEANMVDGSSYLSTFPRMTLKTPLGDRGRGRNLLDGGSPYYDTYETKDGKYMAVGALEPQFFAALLKGLGLEGQGWEAERGDPDKWPELRKVFEEKFRGRTRKEWEEVFDGTDACCTPILEYGELEDSHERGGQGGREGDQRPAVTLRDTPLLAVSEKKQSIQSDDDAAAAARRGRGDGVAGGGYDAVLLGTGEGGEEMLREWVGWERGREFDVQDGGVVLLGEEEEKRKGFKL